MAEHRAQTFHNLVIRGKLWTAVRWITERETGRVFQPEDRCTKTWDRVMEVLLSNHPEAWTPTAASLDSYSYRLQELTPVGITDDTVTEITGQLLGRAGPGGTDSVSLRHWLLRFGASSGELRLIVEDFT